MKKQLILGFRNLRRNIRRSLVTGVSIMIGFTAIALFAGYTDTAYKGLAAQAIHGEMLGHLTIAKRNLATAGRLNPDKYLLTSDEISKITAVVQSEISTVHAAPRLAINGMISNGKSSTIFLAEAVSPKDMEVLRGPRARASGALDGDTTSGITLAQGLAQMLGLKDGDDASLLLSTVRNQANAADAKVVDTFSTGNAGTEDKFVYMPLQFAQNLYDAEGRADRITLILSDEKSTNLTREILMNKLKELNFDIEISTWEELSAFYRQVKSMFDMIFRFLLLIVLVIVVMSVANAMTMSVIERTREIGTFRAMGMRNVKVIQLFITEAFLLVVLGCAAGLLLTFTLRLGINLSEFSYQPPNSTYKVPIFIGFDSQKVILSTILLCMLGMVSAFIPVRNVINKKITDALAHV